MISTLSINGILEKHLVVITFAECVLSGKADVHEYDETSLDQEPIPLGAFYTRRTFDSHEGTIPVCVTIFVRLHPVPNIVF